MARLTRTQKYADLRNQLENGRETEIKSEALNKYEDKLNELNINPVVVEEEIPVITEVKDEIIEEVKEEPVLEETVEVETIDESTQENDDYVPFDFDEVVEEVVENVEEIQEATTSKEDDDFAPIEFEEVSEVVEEVTPIVEEVETVEVTPIVQETTTVIEEIEEEVKEEPVEVIETIEEVQDVTPIIEEVEEIQEVVQEETVEVAPQVEEKLDLNIESLINNIDVQVEEPVEIDNQYLEECLNEVNEYNKSKGLMTAEEVPTTILNEIRGVSETKKETPVLEELVEQEDELSNTVTLEIKKILSELDSSEEENIEEPKVQAQTFEEASGQEELPKEVSDMLKTYLSSIPDDEEEVEEKPIAQTMMVTDMSSIKEDTKLETSNKEDTKDSVIANTALLNETMPLEVTSDNHVAKEHEEEDEEEERGPNRILNFILITLIAVLIFILIFIGYLILVAQGII